MSQHFLLSSKARSLSIMNIVKMSDMEAFEMFKEIRWNKTNEDVICLQKSKHFSPIIKKSVSIFSN